MIEKRDMKDLVNEYVSIGIDHEILPNKLFFYYGVIQEITDKDCKLKTDKGFKIISFNQIKDVHKTRRH